MDTGCDDDQIWRDVSAADLRKAADAMQDRHPAMSADAKAVATGLTKAQRGALIAHAGGPPRASYGNMGAEFNLMLAGLLEIDSKGNLKATDDGLAVRAILAGEP